LSGSMIVLSIPRRLRGPTRADSMRNPNNELANRTFDHWWQSASRRCSVRGWCHQTPMAAAVTWAIVAWHSHGRARSRTGQIGHPIDVGATGTAEVILHQQQKCENSVHVRLPLFYRRDLLRVCAPSRYLRRQAFFCGRSRNQNNPKQAKKYHRHWLSAEVTEVNAAPPWRSWRSFAGTAGGHGGHMRKPTAIWRLKRNNLQLHPSLSGMANSDASLRSRDGELCYPARLAALEKRAYAVSRASIGSRPVAQFFEHERASEIPGRRPRARANPAPGGR